MIRDKNNCFLTTERDLVEQVEVNGSESMDGALNLKSDYLSNPILKK